MPVDALVIPPNPVDHSKIRLLRQFHDLANRPLMGRVTITGTTVTQLGTGVIVPASATVDLVEGVLDIQLPPDTYEIHAEMYSVDRVPSEHRETVTLAAGGEDHG